MIVATRAVATIHPIPAKVQGNAPEVNGMGEEALLVALAETKFVPAVSATAAADLAGVAVTVLVVVKLASTLPTVPSLKEMEAMMRCGPLETVVESHARPPRKSNGAEFSVENTFVVSSRYQRTWVT